MLLQGSRGYFKIETWCLPLMLSLIYYISIILGVLLSIVFYTLYERSILAGAHLRKGPKLLGVFGILQSFADGLKLFVKETICPLASNYLIYLVCPILIIACFIGVWIVLPVSSWVWTLNLMVLILFAITSLRVYAHLGRGWRSNSNYAMIGALRCVAQSLSYEVSIAFLLLSVFILANRLNLIEVIRAQVWVWFAFILIPLTFSWWLRALAETNRAPFDFGEGESELVSGFNVEYGSVNFAFIFIAEYGRIIFMCALTRRIFFSRLLFSPKGLFIISLFLYLFIWVRVRYPRTRYDKLIKGAWLMVLPLRLIRLLIVLAFI